MPFRCSSSVLILLHLLVATASGSDPAAKAMREKKALELVEAAIQAHGGTDAYKRCKQIKTQCTLVEQTTPDVSVKYQVVCFGVPGACRIEVTDTSTGKQHVVVQSGEEVWMSEEGRLASLTERQTALRRTISNLTRASDLVPLLGSERYSVVIADDIEVREKRLRGVCASLPGDNSKVFLYFDDKSLLVRSIYQIPGEVDSVMEYADYRKVEGYLLPHKRTTYENEVEKSVETDLKYTVLEKIDRELFKKPAK